MLLLLDGELLQRQPLVVLGSVEVDQAQLAVAGVAVVVSPRHVDAVDEQVVEGAVVLDGGRVVCPERLADRVGAVPCVDVRVEPGDGAFEPVNQHAVGPGLAFRIDQPLGREVLTVPGGVPDALQPGQHLPFERVLRDVPSHALLPLCVRS